VTAAGRYSQQELQVHYHLALRTALAPGNGHASRGSVTLPQPSNNFALITARAWNDVPAIFRRKMELATTKDLFSLLGTQGFMFRIDEPLPLGYSCSSTITYEILANSDGHQQGFY